MRFEGPPDVSIGALDNFPVQAAVEGVAPVAAASERRKIVVFGALGANVRHSDEALHRLTAKGYTLIGLEHKRPVTQEDRPGLPFEEENIYQTNTTEGEAKADAVFASNEVKLSLISVVPRLHKPLIKDQLGRAARGQVDYVVVPKPAVETPEEAREISKDIRATQAARRELRKKRPELVGGNPDDEVLLVHEHYPEKKAWSTVRQHLGEIATLLGTVDKVTIDVLEEKTIESEHRETAVQGGVFQDLAPHTMSLAFDIVRAINTSTKDKISTRPTATSMQRYRYRSSTLKDNVETGFKVTSKTKITNTESGEASDLDLVMRGGKGLKTQKQVAMEFIHPETQERSRVVVDLANNTIVDAPDSVRHLIPAEGYVDNGYGDTIAEGFGEDKPEAHFQLFSDARKVIIWGARLAIEGQKQGLILHDEGVIPDDMLAA